jgi:hypothetical protein
MFKNNPQQIIPVLKSLLTHKDLKLCRYSSLILLEMGDPDVMKEVKTLYEKEVNINRKDIYYIILQELKQSKE